jgi:hypothetical protein
VTYGELLDFIQREAIKTGGDFLDESVMVYEVTMGQFLPADLISLEARGEDVFDNDKIFLTITT